MMNVETATLRPRRYCNQAVAIHARRCPNCGAHRMDSVPVET